MRIVIGTNVLVSGLPWQGLPRALLIAARDGAFEPVTSVAMLTALTGVLATPKFAAKIAVSGIGVDGLVDGYAALAITVRPLPVTGIAPDPDDDVVIGTALAANAAMIVTGYVLFLGVGNVESTKIVTVAGAVQAPQNMGFWQ